MSKDGIVFTAIFNKATTTVDHSWNVTFSVDESQAEAVMELARYRDYVLQVAVVPITNESKLK